MRTLLRVTIDVQAGNRAIQEKRMQQLLPQMMERLKPEAAYFLGDDGIRTAYIFFDMKDSSQMVVIGEPLFQQLNARVEFMPVMNADDLMKGLAEAEKQR